MILQHVTKHERYQTRRYTCVLSAPPSPAKLLLARRRGGGMHAPTRAPSGRSRAHASIACISAAARLGPSSLSAVCTMPLLTCAKDQAGARRRVSRSDRARVRAGSSRARRHTYTARPSAGPIAQSAPGAPRSARRAHRDEDRASGEMLTAEDVRQKHSEAYKLGSFELLRRTN